MFSRNYVVVFVKIFFYACSDSGSRRICALDVWWDSSNRILVHQQYGPTQQDARKHSWMERNSETKILIFLLTKTAINWINWQNILLIYRTWMAFCTSLYLHHATTERSNPSVLCKLMLRSQKIIKQTTEQPRSNLNSAASRHLAVC
jgi:hypothetical protein